MTLASEDTARDVADGLLRHAHSSAEGRSAPYPLYSRIREIAPLYRSSLDDMWYVSRYDDCKALLGDPRLGSGQMRPRYGVSESAAAGQVRIGTASLLMTNPPEHTRLRALVNQAFTPRRADGL